jgi:hypothetical protein
MYLENPQSVSRKYQEDIAVFEKTILRQFPFVFSRNWLKLAHFEHFAISESIPVQS